MSHPVLHENVRGTFMASVAHMGRQDMMDVVSNELVRSVDAGMAPMIRVVRDGRSLPAWPQPALLSSRRPSIEGLTSEVALDLLTEALERGYTIQIRGAERYSAVLADACRKLEEIASKATGVGVRHEANVYVSLSNTQAFPFHLDESEVIVVQVAGKKTWEVTTEPHSSDLFVADCLTDDESSNLQTVAHVLEPGNALWVPYGHAHKVSANEGGSFHVTFGRELQWQLQRLVEILSTFQNEGGAVSSAVQQWSPEGIVSSDHELSVFEKALLVVARTLDRCGSSEFSSTRDVLRRSILPVGDRVMDLLGRTADQGLHPQLR